MRFIVMFVTAVCVLFLIKLRWPKKKNFYKRGIFSAKMVYERVRGWTSGWSLPVQNFVKYPPPPPVCSVFEYLH